MDESLLTFTEALASSAPTPGGGGAAALMGSLAASLGAMCARLSAGRRRAEGTEELDGITAACEELRLRFLEQIEADAEAFRPLAAAYRLPKEQPDRAEILRRSSIGACAAAAEMLFLCVRTTEQLQRLRALVERCGSYLRVNTGVKHIFGLLAVDAIDSDRNRGNDID